ncbi:putative 26S proteasome regulatory subunit [Lecanora helva]
MSTTCLANKLIVRTTRARIICLRNDYKSLMSKIEIGLHEHHAAHQASDPTPTAPSSQATSAGSTVDQGLVDTPFAKVNSVVDRSPADEAGLKAGDRIRRVGNVNWINHEKLSKVAEVVQRNQGE